MSTSVPEAAPRSFDLTGTSRVPFARLASVELRKMLDTRGGVWLLALTLLFCVLAVGVTLLVVALDSALGVPGIMDWMQILALPLSVLLPVFPILAVTSEWSQRTTLVTFSLEPNRLKVVFAKLMSVVVLAAGTLVFAAVVGVVATPVGAALGGGDVNFDVEWQILGGTLLAQLIYFLMAFALGTALLNTPGAISVFYVMGLMVPIMVYSTLFVFFDWAENVIPWIDIQFASTPFVEPGMEVAGGDWARLLTATAIWVVAPLVFGVSRILRSEVK